MSEEQVRVLTPNDPPIIRAMKLFDMMVARVKEHCPQLTDEQAKEMAWDWHSRAGKMSKEINSALECMLPEILSKFVPLQVDLGMETRTIFAPIDLIKKARQCGGGWSIR